MALFIGEGRSRKVLQNEPQPNKLLPIHGIKEKLANPLGVEKRRKFNLSTPIRVNYRPKGASLSRVVVPTVGRKQVCDFFEADGSAGSNTHVLQTCMTFIKGEDDPLVVCTLFAGALAAHHPALSQKVKKTLTDIGVDPRIIYLPEQAVDHGIDLEANDEYDVCDSHVIMGVCVCILFKNISDGDYSQFISNQLHELAGKLGMSKSRLAELTHPVTLNQAKYIRETLRPAIGLKKEILLNLMGLADVGGYTEAVSKYQCKILSWNEMTSFRFVYEKLYQPGSPVLSLVHVRHEAIKFAEAACAVD